MADCRALTHFMSSPRADDTVIAFRDRKAIGFAEFLARTCAWRAVFAAQSGTRVALYFEDAAEFASALFGAWHVGKQVLLAPDVLPATLARLAEDACAIAADVAISGPLPWLRGDLDATTESNFEPLDASVEWLQVFTSGSTGTPVRIGKRLTQLDAEIDALEQAFGASLEDAVVHASVTQQHMYGLPFRVLWPLRCGRAFSARRLAFPEDIRHALVMERSSVLITSPAHLKRLPEHLDWASTRGRIRAVFSSGGPLSSEAHARCVRLLDRQPFEIYGSSETGAVAWRQRDVDVDHAWQPLPGMSIAIDGERMQLRAAWLHDPNGEFAADRVTPKGSGFALLGRGDRIVKVEEKRVSLDAIEQQLIASGMVQEARALVIPALQGRIGVVVVPDPSAWAIHETEGRRVLAERLRQVLAKAFDAVLLPRHWRFVSALPVNATGKTTTQALTALFDPRHLPVRVLEHQEASARLLIEVPASSPFFDGHFAAAPIFPGVAQIDLAIRHARALFGLSEDFARLEQVKFHDWIEADARVELSLQRSAGQVVDFRIDSVLGRHASGRIVFGGAP